MLYVLGKSRYRWGWLFADETLSFLTFLVVTCRPAEVVLNEVLHVKISDLDLRLDRW